MPILTLNGSGDIISEVEPLQPGMRYAFWFTLEGLVAFANGTLYPIEVSPELSIQVPFQATVGGDNVTFDLTAVFSGRFEFVAVSRGFSFAVAGTATEAGQRLEYGLVPVIR